MAWEIFPIYFLPPVSVLPRELQNLDKEEGITGGKRLCTRFQIFCFDHKVLA